MSNFVDDILSKTWSTTLSISPHLVMGLSRNAEDFFGEVTLERGRSALRYDLYCCFRLKM